MKVLFFPTAAEEVLSGLSRPIRAAPTVLQRGDGLALPAVLAVPDVIGGFHTELVGRERLQPSE